MSDPSKLQEQPESTIGHKPEELTEHPRHGAEQDQDHHKRTRPERLDEVRRDPHPDLEQPRSGYED